MSLVIDYLRLRRAVGVLGVCLPFALLLAAGPQESLSDYYHTEARDLFVIALGVIGALLVSYRGYDEGDRAASGIAGFSLIAVAMFPVGGITNTLHYVAACCFFVASAELCRRFGFGGYKPRTFQALAAVILVAIASAFVGVPLMLAESVAVVAFGAAWLLKGKVMERE